ncbi:efflux RND transporter periplasmic adaptor subunit [Kallotenue papyrolyticum]|uniref:efflux RND transporter periplasmic adaptor subunit n=1 Tax=Kallotenue papyrolyticum TaxID=1325125 RepID=UPI00047867BA|nr:efflux RND transporter periplasmic adaptor subunit [Kallotenue papyrolyticum]
MQRWMHALMLGSVALVLAACAGRAPQTSVDTTTVRRGTLTITVSSSGTVQPLRSANLNFGASGTVAAVLVREGQRVREGQELARLDLRDLDQQVRQAEANLKTAQARLTQAQAGNATPQDLAAQEASIAAARAQLERARTGNVTGADIAAAEAAVRSAQANLTRARTGNVTEADIANAEAAVRAAEAQLEAVKRGPTPDQVSAAQTRLAQAQENLRKVSAAASAAKTRAEQDMLQAADAVRLAQSAYSSAYWDNQQAQNGIDPKSGRRFSELGLDEEIQKRQYAEALRTAELQLSQAQSRLEQAKVAYDTARQQEIADVATAQAQVNDAQVQLDELLKGPDASEVARAQAQVDQARAQLQKLRQGGTTADIAAARAQLDQAVANLNKLKQGGTPADIAAARAQLDQAQAQYERLTAGASPSDIEIAAAGVAQAEAQLEAAKLNRERAVLRAPFSGIVTEVNIAVGDLAASAGAAGAAIVLVDDSQRYLEVSVSENDVVQIREGQSAQVRFDALETRPITGTVSYIAPAATVVQNVTTYAVRIDLPQVDTAIRVGMNATVDIATTRKAGVLIIPASALRSEGSKRFVRVQRGDRFEDREVQIGLSNDVEVEVISGLEEGEQIATIGTPPAATP